MSKRELELVRDVLDNQLVDCNETKMGRVDGMVIEFRDGAPPRVDHLELGFVVLAERLHPRLEQWLQAIRKRWSVRRSGRFSVPWKDVEEVNQHHIKLDLDAESTPQFDWEKWLRKHVVDKLPGGEG